MLFHGPPGLGKTTLATILAHELGVEITHTSGPVIERPGDLAGLLTNLGPARHPVRRRDPPPEPGGRGVPLSGARGLHARHPARPRAERPLAQDQPRALHAGGRHDALGPAVVAAARALRRHAAARLLRAPRISPHIVRRSAGILGVDDRADDAAVEIARRARGTPRVANRLLRRVRDFALIKADGRVTLAGHARGAARCSRWTSAGSTRWIAGCSTR